MPVVVVTDSSSCLPLSVAGHYAIRTVPLHLSADGVDYRDGVDEVPENLVTTPGVNTSGANPHELGEAFEEAVAASDGAGVVAVHISRKLSGTWGAARLAAEKFSGRVRVVDSRSVGLAVGFAAIAAAQAAADGADRDRVYEAAIRQAATLDSMFCVSTLDNLRASGRISAAGKMLGSALSIKPILHMVDGTMTLKERHRTFSKAIAKLKDGALESAGGRAVTLGVQHCEAPELAAEVADDLRKRLKVLTSSIIVEISPVLGCHVGPGAVGVVIGTHLDPIEGIPGN
ncbi:DegV family EDD domain-containing protein [Gordonia amarae]|uniref:DegV family protein n=2 Tax=Gordonia amarae TaxID=36821 RepID=G7GJN2_9ACTN|nr:DegV family protein [Gordonia amarae]MCS3879797.1 DegV family protein with EDD domain [Gordonia amarae]QHN18223.1 DegV family EDD domain-containing protein [Gordonia amarae]QHN22707.1 DegV family EDD domain-containing protein [Gordonia amarae]QHN31610.1 DegV family EDD domain-containing protein [Gordonia amarae]QHN40354.1 DegV family EDD domain-containing protein [Gordonia amarae]